MYSTMESQDNACDYVNMIYVDQIYNMGGLEQYQHAVCPYFIIRPVLHK